MSVCGHLLCNTCKVQMFLGKWLRKDGRGFGFWMESSDAAKLGLRTLNFLAAHVDHDILVLSDAEYDRRSASDGFDDYADVFDQLRDDWAG